VSGNKLEMAIPNLHPRILIRHPQELGLATAQQRFYHLVLPMPGFPFGEVQHDNHQHEEEKILLNHGFLLFAFIKIIVAQLDVGRCDGHQASM
jgi:hypothetical protein